MHLRQYKIKTKALMMRFFIFCAFMSFATVSFAAFPARPLHTVACKTENSPAGQMNRSTFTLKNKVQRLLPFTGHLLRPEEKTGPYGTWSLIFGIASIALIWMGGGLFAIPAIILGLEGKKRHEKYSNAGYILGQIGGIITLVAIVVGLLLLLLFIAGTGI